MGDSSEQERLGQLFQACDLDGSGFIDQTELASVCTELDVEELKDVFSQLDKDGDGRISVEEFARGFQEINEAMQGKSREKIRQTLKSASSMDCLAGNDLYANTGLDDSLKSLTWPKCRRVVPHNILKINECKQQRNISLC
ncbi:hypothetical protein LOTGIDRAFT_163419 [Lottia gigantea]|uniref:EF-hand domain-containing protein n=1 Tax=Lottia gigantea TaxID=225164 RepID=V4A9D0_LOTGI|nr:hypothetical protein LOTGIDRAFT_163419 [Lottia gigantea]ESO91690.1 hypothetical protein LOTGIDRAFT_163419 [Lottia gigantea]